MYALLDINLVHRSPTNPRTRFDQTKLEELAASIKEHEVMQPIVVRLTPGLFDTYEIIAGERRWRASKLAGVKTIPATIRELTDLQVLQLQVIENSQREDLHPLEEAKGFKAILDNKDAENWTADQLAEKVGKSRSYVYNTLKLNELCVYAQDKFLDGRFGREIAQLIARIPGEKLQTEATKAVITPNWQGNNLTFKEAQKVLRENYTLKLASAPFKITDENLVPAAGSCKTCPRRSGNCPEDFPDIESPDVCTNTECFSTKKAAHVAQLKDAGSKVLEGAEAKKILPRSWDLHSDYVKLDDNCPGKAESFQKVLGKEPANVITIVDEASGDLVKVAKKTDVQAALQAKGVNITFSAARNYSAEEKEKERKLKIENAYRLAVLTRISEELANDMAADPALEDFEQTVVARAMINRLDHEAKKRLLRLRGIPFTSDEGPHRAADKLNDDLEIMPTHERLVLIMQLALVGESMASQWSTREPTNLNTMAKNCGIDLIPIRAAAEESFAPKTKAAKNAKHSPTPLPAAQAQEINADGQAELIDPPAMAPALSGQTPVENDIAPGALPGILPAETAGDLIPAAQASESIPAAAPLSGFEKAKLKGEKEAARRKASRDKKEAANAADESGADQLASANHAH